MKRIESCPINRNNDTVFKHINRGPFYINTEAPETVMSQIWLQDNETSALDIIELNSSNSTETSTEDAPEYLHQAWNYINTDQSREQENNYSVNKKARQKRRLQNEIRRQLTAKPQASRYNNNLTSDRNVTVNNLHKTNVTSNHPINCFTIIKKNLNSDTSSDQEDCSVELTTQMGDMSVNHEKNGKYVDVAVPFELDVQEKKRIIWIYSFKNKQHLPENERNSINTSFDTDSSTCSFENFSEETNINNSVGFHRISSPIPSIYVPRLDLSAGQTLSTVTELSESNKHPSPAVTERSINIVVEQKPINNWFANHNEDINDEVIGTEKGYMNVVNWLALSPREKIRRYNSNSKVKIGKKREKLQESSDIESNLIHNEKNKDSKTMTDFVAKTQINNLDYSNKMGNKKTISTPTSKFKKEPTCNALTINSIQSLNESIKTEPDITDNMEDKETFNISSHKPQIKLSKKHVTRASKVSSPIEKLDSNNWILEEEGIKQSSVYGYKLEPIGEVVNENVSNVSTRDRVWRKNAMSLMKPARWNEYQPITETSISLSLSLNSGLGKKPWFSRLMKCFTCFK